MIYTRGKGLGDVIEVHDDVMLFTTFRKEAGSCKRGTTRQGRTCVQGTIAFQHLTSTTAVHVKCSSFGSSRTDLNIRDLATCIA